MANASPSGRRFNPATIALIAAALIAGIAIGIAAFGSDSETGIPGNAMANAAREQAPSLEAMTAAMAEELRRDPDNHEGWYMLGRAYREGERFADAAGAFRRAMELQPRNVDYHAYLAEMLLIQSTRAARPVPAEAERLLRRALELQPRHPMSRFYLATIRDDRGDHRGAIDDMIALLRDARPGETWPRQVRSSVLAIAERNNIDIEGRLPAAPAPPPASAATAGIPGPTREQMEAARAIPPSQQDAMGRQMADRLAARLRASPRDEARWIMLMRSRMVLNDPRAAAEALRSGLAAFNGDAAAQGRLRQAARELGVPGAT